MKNLLNASVIISNLSVKESLRGIQGLIEAVESPVRFINIDNCRGHFTFEVFVTVKDEICLTCLKTKWFSTCVITVLGVVFVRRLIVTRLCLQECGYEAVE